MSNAGTTIVVSGSTLTIIDNSTYANGIVKNTDTSGGTDAVSVVNDGTLILKSGKIESKSNGIYVYSGNNGKVIIEGGSLTADGNTTAIAIANSDGNGSISIVGGYVYAKELVTKIHGFEVASIELKGGSYDFEPNSNYIPDGYKLNGPDANGMYTITATDPMIYNTTTNTGYYKLSSALEAAQENETIEIREAGTYTWPNELSSIEIAAGVTVKGTVDGVIATSDGINAINATTLTVENIDFTAIIKAAYVNNCKAEELTFNNCSFTATGVEAGTGNDLYAFHVNCAAPNAVLNFNNCAFDGFTTFATTISEINIEGGSVDGALIIRQDANISGVEFTETSAIQIGTTDVVAGVELVIEGCTVENGGDITDIFNGNGNGAAVTLDGTLIYGDARIGETYYATLQDAVEAATEGGEIITVVPDVINISKTESYDRVLIKGKTLTIDLNGKTVKTTSESAGEDDVFLIEGGDNGTGANVTIINGTINHSSCGIISRGANAENTIIINDVDFVGNNEIYPAVYHNGSSYGCGVTISNSTITSKVHGLYISGYNGWNGQLNNVIIENSIITSEVGSAVEIKQGNLYVENSIITTTDTDISMSNYNNGSCSSGFAIALTNNYVDENGHVTNDESTGTIEIVSGTFNGAIGIKANNGTSVVANNGNASISISGGTFSINHGGLLDGYCADGFTLTTNVDGTFGVVPVNGVAQIKRGEDIISSHTTLYDAVAAAVNGDIITLLCNVNGAGIVIDKSITIDFGGYTYTFEKPAVGSPGTQTIGFQILQGKTVTLKNGTLQVSINDEDRLAFAMLIQNYANLTITDMTLDGTNLDRYIMMDQYNYSYVLSNNCGNVSVNGETNIIANPGGDQIGEYGPEDHHGVAFDVCTYATYEAPVVTVNTTGNIKGVVEVSAELHLVAVGDESDITIDMSGDGQLYHNVGGINGTSTKSVKGTEDGWGTISSPMGKVNHEDVEGLLSSLGNHDLYRYNEKTYTWENVKHQNNSFSTLDAGRGYLYANTEDTDVIFSGTYNVNNTDVTLTYTTGAGSLAGFNMVGNPFAHDIDHTHFYTHDNEATLAEGFYVMNTNGAWVAKADNAKIGAMESVFVKTNKETKLTIFKNAVSKSRGENNGMLEINVANAKYNDVAYVSFNKGLGLDKIAHRNNEIPMVYVPVDGTDYAVAMMSKDVTEIPVSFMAMTMGEYTFSAKAIDCEFEQMYLVDRMTGIETNLLMDDYTFMAKSGDNAERFIIRMENSANANTNTENFVFVNNDELIFNNIAGEGIIRIIDVLGRPVAEYNVFGSANISTTSFRSGVYMIQMSDENGVKVQKVIVD